MKKRLNILLVFLVLSACETAEWSNEEVTSKERYISSISFSDETGIDSLFYNEKNQLLLKKEYISADQLDYSTHYEYDLNDKLTRVYRMHSSANSNSTPSESINYSYYTNGKLKSKETFSYQHGYRTNFEYETNTIFVNRNEANEIRINLASNNRILSVERKDINGEFNKFKEFIYDGDNIIEVRITEYSGAISYFFEFDARVNPFFVYDHPLPDNLSIKKLEAVLFNSNYPFLTIGDNDNLFGFLNKNNVISCSGNASSYYNYTYTSENYPNEISYAFLSSPSSLVLTYY